MKLWLKITLICACIMIFIFFASVSILLIEASNKILEVTLDNALNTQSTLSSSFYNMVNYYDGIEEDTTSVEEYAVVRYCFSRFANQTSLLMLGDEVIYGNNDIDAEEILQINQRYEQQHFIGTVNGVKLLIVGSQTTFSDNTYTIYTIQDISSTYQTINEMILKFIVIGLVFIIAGIVIVLVLVRYSLSPIQKLSDTTRRISMGSYNVRAEIQTKDEIGALAKDFNLMAEAIENHIAQLENIADRQRLFIGGLTHEFKTPLTALIGYAETLLNTKQPANVVDESLKFIHERCRWIERLTQKLLKLITIQEDINLKETSVRNLFAIIQNDVEEMFRKREIKLLISCEIDTLKMDSDLMRSALINLCDNAAKASEPGQQIFMHACDNMIEIVDHGTGISDEQVIYITEPFYMIDRSRNKKNGGSGLGLAIVKKIVESHNAQLQFESIVGKGTTARIIFP